MPTQDYLDLENQYGAHNYKPLDVVLTRERDEYLQLADRAETRSDPDLQRLLLVEHLALQLYLALVESMVSEQGARLQAMDAAKSNIDDRNAELKRTYNTARQEKITQEMLELASGGGSI